MRYSSEQRPTRQIRWHRMPMALLVLLCCSATFVAGRWDGRRTSDLTLDQAWEVLEDPTQPERRKLLAGTQVFRVGERAKGMLEKLREREGELGRSARRHFEEIRR